MRNSLEIRVIVIMEEAIDRIFVQQGESLLFWNKGRKMGKEKIMQLRTMNMSMLRLQRNNLISKFCVTKNVASIQRRKTMQELFKVYCSIKNKVHSLIVDNGSTKNLVSHKFVDYLKLSIEPHEKPYTLVWVIKRS